MARVNEEAYLARCGALRAGGVNARLLACCGYFLLLGLLLEPAESANAL